MELGVELYRAATLIEAPHGRLLADRMARSAVELPALLSDALSRGEDPERLAEAQRELARIETELELTRRVSVLSARQAAPAVERAAALRQALDELSPEPEAPPSAPRAPAGTPQPAAAPPPVSVSQPAAAARPPRPPAPPARAEGPGEVLVVDGCNFLGRAPDYSLGDDASRDRLLLRLQEYSHRHPSHRVVVFFDGQRASRRVTAGVEEHVTSGRRPADDVMIDYLRALSTRDRSRCVLVTDDLDLQRRAKDTGVRARAVSWLVQRIPEPAEPTVLPGGQGGLSKSQVNQWEQFFQAPPQRPPGKR